jgi:hypothetical protein
MKPHLPGVLHVCYFEMVGNNVAQAKIVKKATRTQSRNGRLSHSRSLHSDLIYTNDSTEALSPQI